MLLAADGLDNSKLAPAQINRKFHLSRVPIASSILV
jgi:hypothetical protein